MLSLKLNNDIQPLIWNCICYEQAELGQISLNYSGLDWLSFLENQKSSPNILNLFRKFEKLFKDSNTFFYSLECYETFLNLLENLRFSQIFRYVHESFGNEFSRNFMNEPEKFLETQNPKKQYKVCYVTFEIQNSTSNAFQIPTFPPEKTGALVLKKCFPPN